MSTKTKTKNTFFSEFNFEKLTAHLGFAAMSAAAMLSLVELEHLRAQKIEVFQPAYATVNSTPFETNRGDELLRREKEDSPHSMVSYGTTMRSHATTGKQ